MTDRACICIRNEDGKLLVPRDPNCPVHAARNRVWLVVGWFGGDEWIESVHATEAGADAACAEGWKARHSDKEPEHIKGYGSAPGADGRGLAKFGVEEHEVLP